MKALMGAAAIVVILTCGYFVYDDRQAKAEQAETERRLAATAEYLNCRKSLGEVKSILESVNLWEGRTHLQRVDAINDSEHPVLLQYGELLTSMYEVRWEECGPI